MKKFEEYTFNHFVSSNWSSIGYFCAQIPISTSNSPYIDLREMLFLSSIIPKFLHFVTGGNGNVSAEYPDGFYINISSNEVACWKDPELPRWLLVWWYLMKGPRGINMSSIMVMHVAGWDLWDHLFGLNSKRKYFEIAQSYCRV